MDWTPDFVRTFVNGSHIWSLDITGISEFHQPFYLIANMAVGGQFTGIMSANDVSAAVPGRMEIDYIRIYHNAEVDATMTIGGILRHLPMTKDQRHHLRMETLVPMIIMDRHRQVTMKILQPIMESLIVGNRKRVRQVS